MPSYHITSPKTPDYNCVAWAAEEDFRWWEPDPQGTYYWPSDAPRTYTIDALVKAFLCLDYEICGDYKKEAGYKKVAIFADRMDRPTHAARQLDNGQWTSKLGKNVDIEHALDALENLVPEYGQVRFILRKPT